MGYHLVWWEMLGNFLNTSTWWSAASFSGEFPRLRPVLMWFFSNGVWIKLGTCFKKHREPCSPMPGLRFFGFFWMMLVTNPKQRACCCFKSWIHKGTSNPPNDPEEISSFSWLILLQLQFHQVHAFLAYLRELHQVTSIFYPGYTALRENVDYLWPIQFGSLDPRMEWPGLRTKRNHHTNNGGSCAYMYGVYHIQT